MVWRAVRLRCPHCGSRRTFLRGWFRRYPRCRTCGIAWQRETGLELGAVTINTLVTFLSIVVGMIIGFVATVPEVPVLAMVFWLGLVAALMPIVIYPFTYTIWLAFDLAVHPVDGDERAAAAAAVGAEVPVG